MVCMHRLFVCSACGCHADSTHPAYMLATPPPPGPPVCRSITTYKGNYDVFVKTAEERLRNATKAAEAQAAKRAHVQVRATAACCVWTTSFCTCS
jgi:ATPase subunit of ABC transporter with duplicated ATPase domains